MAKAETSESLAASLRTAPGAAWLNAEHVERMLRATEGVVSGQSLGLR